MSATLPTDALVTDVIRAEALELMAERMSLKPRWMYRTHQAEMAAEIQTLLEQYAVIAWGPAPWRV